MSRVRTKLTYANVMSSIAVFGMLAGGGAYATSKIGPQGIKKNAVRAKHVKENQIRAKHLKRNQVRRRHIADGAVTQAKLAEGVMGSGPPGPRGQTGPRGPAGPQGAPGPATGPAGGDLAASYPNPVIRNGAVTRAKLAPNAKVHWAVVNPLGNVVRSSGGADSELLGTGSYVVTIEGTDSGDCAGTVTAWTQVDEGWAFLRFHESRRDDWGVEVRNASGDPEAMPFMIQVTC